MPWTTPDSSRPPGYLVTSDNWNELADDLKHLRGQDGTTTLEGHVVSDTDLTYDVGSDVLRWKAGFFDALYASNAKRRLHGYVRRVHFGWEQGWTITYKLEIDTTNGGSVLDGGTGQIVLKTDDDGASTVDLYQMDAENSAKANAFNASRSPYMRIEFSMDQFSAEARLQIGWEDTPADDVRWTANDNVAGLTFNGAIWVAQTSDGGGSYTGSSNIAAITADQRHVLEILVIASGDTLFWIDGTLVHTSSTKQPTGDLKMAIHMWSANGGTGDTLVTLGDWECQEDLS